MAADEAIELAWTANAYVQSAAQLCSWLVDERYERDRHHYRVPLHVTYLALELGYKAGIAAANAPYSRSHDLVDLRAAYERHMPAIPLPIPTFIDRLLPQLTEELFPDQPAATSTWQFTRFRYYADSRGRPFPELELADLQLLQQEIRELHTAITRLLVVVRS